MDGNIGSTAKILSAALALAVAGPLQAQEKPVVSATATSPTIVQLGWTTPTGATEYGVQRGPGPGGPWSPLGPPVSQPAYTDASAQPGTTYAYRVRTKVAGQNVVSDAALVTTPPAGDPPGGRGGRADGGGPAAGMPAAAVGPAFPGVQPLPVQQGPIGAKDAAAVGPAISSLPNLVCDVELEHQGEQASFRITVENTGGSGAGSSLAVLVAKTGAQQPLLPPTQLLIGALAPGGSVALPPVVVMEGVTAVDVWALGLNAETTIDAGSAVTESNEMDNSCSGEVGDI